MGRVGFEFDLPLDMASNDKLFFWLTCLVGSFAQLEAKLTFCRCLASRKSPSGPRVVERQKQEPGLQRGWNRQGGAGLFCQFLTEIVFKDANH